MTTALQTIERNGIDVVPMPLTAREIRAQVNLIQEVMREVMQGPTVIDGKEVPGVHFGTVPGCGDKPTLLQPGAHKLLMTFRLVADPDMTIVAMERGHREVRCKVKIYSQGGVLLGAGVGTCSTMEGKYRYRTGPVEFTDKLVPREYWDLRNSDPKKAKALIGEGMIPKKDDAGRWVCARQGEKVEHDNPADYYNTVEKMAYKRALVSATLTVTAASDIFTQDIEDMPEVIPGAQATAASVPTAKPAEQSKPVEPAKPTDKGSSVLGKMTASKPPAASPSATPAPKPTEKPAEPIPTVPAGSLPETQPLNAAEASFPSSEETTDGYPAEWLSNVIEAEDYLRGSVQGQNTLRSIRAGFNLQGDQYPMLVEHQAEYLDTLKRTAKRLGAK